MIKTYLNYPNYHISAHTDMSCNAIQKMDKAVQRTISFDPNTFSSEIVRFIRKEHRFASQSEFNDMWLYIDFGNRNFETAVLNYIHILLEKYKPFAQTDIEWHC